MGARRRPWTGRRSSIVIVGRMMSITKPTFKTLEIDEASILLEESEILAQLDQGDYAVYHLRHEQEAVILILSGIGHATMIS